MAIRPFAAALLLSALALPAVAAPATGAAPAPQAATPPSRDMGSNYDLLETTCGSFLTILAIANPGANPSDDRKQEAQNAQAAAYRAMIWVHGYMSGKRGVDAAAMPLSRAWLVKTVPVVADQCKKDPAQLLFKAVAAL